MAKITRTAATCRLALLTASAGLALCGAASASAQQVGIAAAIDGEVSIAVTEKAKARKIARKQAVSLGNLIRTKKKAELDILLRDKSTFSVPEETRLVIDRYVYDPGKERSVVARLIYGAARFFSGEKTPRSTAKIKSPSAEMGILGTAVDTIVGKKATTIAKDEPAIPDGIDHDKKTATLVVLRGPGPATEGDLTPGFVTVTGGGKTIELTEPGLAGYVPYVGATPIGPFRISGSGLSDVMERQQTSMKSGGGIGLGEVLAGLAVITAGALLLSGGDDEGGTLLQPTSPTSDDHNDDYPIQ